MSDYNTTMLSLEPGDSLSGRYRLERVIGEGGMAVVWLATDLNLDRHVAIKVLPTALSRDVRAITRLKAEAVRNLELTHPNIVRLYGFEQDPVRGNQAYLVMQYVEGGTLHEILAEYPNGLPKDELEKWSKEIASAVDFAHERGVLHRDIKPSNIIIEDATGIAYLMDFGIARETRDTMTMVTGRQQESSGTLPYMSPQQLVGKNNKSNDIYSFAATLYEALCGHPPFHTGEIAYQIREIDPEPIESLSKNENSSLLAGLAKDAGKRPGTCFELLTCQPSVSVRPCQSKSVVSQFKQGYNDATKKEINPVFASRKSGQPYADRLTPATKASRHNASTGFAMVVASFIIWFVGGWEVQLWALILFAAGVSRIKWSDYSGK
jgi:serine/threonine protein kinase